MESGSRASDYDTGRSFSLHPNIQEGGSSSLHDGFSSLYVSANSDEQPEASTSSPLRRTGHHRRQPRKFARLIWNKRSEDVQQALYDTIGERLCIANLDAEDVLESQLTEALEASLLSKKPERIASALLTLFPDYEQSPRLLTLLPKEQLDRLVQKFMDAFDEPKDSARGLLRVLELDRDMAQKLLSMDGEAIVAWTLDRRDYLNAHRGGDYF
ncbi:hypothetical protein CBS101457_000235 [Exobasidium rhododendri]|nr:hypothetical protein CBS101457_000235 [Exobasidium rhododendri]